MVSTCSDCSSICRYYKWVVRSIAIYVTIFYPRIKTSYRFKIIGSPLWKRSLFEGTFYLVNTLVNLFKKLFITYLVKMYNLELEVVVIHRNRLFCVTDDKGGALILTRSRRIDVLSPLLSILFQDSVSLRILQIIVTIFASLLINNFNSSLVHLYFRNNAFLENLLTHLQAAYGSIQIL